jgi:hypothetical protein
VSAPHGSLRADKLWKLDGKSPVEALRGERVAGASASEYTFAFRRDGAVWIGTASGGKSLSPIGKLSRIGGLGPKIGSPAVATSDGSVLVAWADRAPEQTSWGLRYVVFKAGQEPGEPKAFAVPAGGPGQNAMSPDVAGLPGGRFLVVWTEGPQLSQQVRAQTINAEGAPIGTALKISADGVNAGQGQAAVTPGGRGAVAYLSASSAGEGFEVVAMPITCPM